MNRFIFNLRNPLLMVNSLAMITALGIFLYFFLPDVATYRQETLITGFVFFGAAISFIYAVRNRIQLSATTFITLAVAAAATLGYSIGGLSNPTVYGLLFIAMPFASLYFDRSFNRALAASNIAIIVALYWGGVNGLAGMLPIDADDFVIMVLNILGTGAILDFTLTRFRFSLQEAEAARDELTARNLALDESRGELELRVDERTRDLARRAAQLEASAEVAREAAVIRNLQALLDQVVNLISARFGYYHAGIFLLDEAREYAVLQAASSEGGLRMLARGHRLQVGKVGVVGFAAGQGQPRIAQDVGADVIYYDNPDMPETHSELALPLKVRDEIIGVLDVQAREQNAFTAEGMQILTILADQVAVAIENARLLESSRRALEELQVVYGQRVAQAWRRRLETESPEYRYDRLGIAQAAHGAPLQAGDPERFLSQSIIFRDQPIGALELMREDSEPPFTPEERSLVEDIMEQTALALENARLVDEIRLRSDQIQLLQEITSLAASLRSEEELLQEVAEKLQAGMDLLHAGVVLFNEERTEGTVVATASRKGAPGASAIGNVLPLRDNAPTLEVIDTHRPVIIYDVQNHPGTAAFRESMKPRGTYTLAIIPLITRGEVIGSIGLDVAEANRRFDEEDLTLFNQVSAQVAQALDSTRLFQAEQRGRQAAAALLEITQIAASTLELRQVLREVTQRSARAVQADRCSVFLIDPKSDYLEPVMAQYADGRADETLWQQFRTVGFLPLEAVPALQKVAATRQPLALNAPPTAEMLPPSWLSAFRSQTTLAVPLLSQNRVIGIMIFDHIRPGTAFAPDQVDLAQTIAGQVATTIANANLFEQTVRRAERERLVSEITTKVRASNDPRVILQTAISELRSALGVRPGGAAVRTQQSDYPGGNGAVTNGSNGHTIKPASAEQEE
ncbi:MAG: GAF domain-containing protein [Anaerolineae bacterium]|nr:MAG: GAF domain-containing protein [Anaerolineae bacterium]